MAQMTREQAMEQRAAKLAMAKMNFGDKAKKIGVLPKYMAMGSWNPCKKRRPRNGG